MSPTVLPTRAYAGITKGLTALATSMILAAERAGAGQALHDELAASQALLLGRFARSLRDMYPKAYRWVAEMQEIAEFIGPAYPESGMFDGAAGLYERVAADVAGLSGYIVSMLKGDRRRDARSAAPIPARPTMTIVQVAGSGAPP